METGTAVAERQDSASEPRRFSLGPAPYSPQSAALRAGRILNAIEHFLPLDWIGAVAQRARSIEALLGELLVLSRELLLMPGKRELLTATVEAELSDWQGMKFSERYADELIAFQRELAESIKANEEAATAERFVARIIRLGATLDRTFRDCIHPSILEYLELGSRLDRLRHPVPAWRWLTYDFPEPTTTEGGWTATRAKKADRLPTPSLHWSLDMIADAEIQAIRADLRRLGGSALPDPIEASDIDDLMRLVACWAWSSP